MQRESLVILARLLHSTHSAREREQEPLQDLEECEIRSRNGRANQDVVLGVAFENGLKVSEVFGNAKRLEVLGSAESLVLLILIVQGVGDWVVHVVGFGAEIESGQSKLINSSLLMFIRARKFEFWGEIGEDGGGLGESPAVVDLQNRDCEMRPLWRELGGERIWNVDFLVFGVGVLEGETNILGAVSGARVCREGATHLAATASGDVSSET